MALSRITNYIEADGADLNLQSSDTTITVNSILGQINFSAPSEASGTDAILLASNIKAFAEGTFAAGDNATTLEFSVGRSAASGSDGGRLQLTSTGNLILKNQNTADDSFPTITLQTGDTDIAQDDVLGRILFQAPDEGAGTDAITSSARIQAISEGDFSASSNVTSLEFRTASSGVVGTASQGSKLTLTSDFQLQLKSMHTGDGSFPIFELQTGETAVETNDILGSISWKAPDESGGTDAITQAAFIIARAGADFTSSVNDTKLQFGTGLSASAGTRFTLDATGDAIVEDGDLVIGTAGHGIDFSAQTLSSNIVGSPKSEVLEHYETGQFNADITSTTGSGDVTIYNHALGVTENQASRYIRIGSLVTIFGSHVVQSWGSRTGTLSIANLPFPIWGGGGYSGSPTHFPADTRDASVTMSGGGSYFQFSKNNGTLVAGTSEHWQISDLMTMKYLTYTFTYFTNIS